MKNYLIIMFCILLFYSSSAQEDAFCEQYNTMSSELIFEFQMYGDTAKLDSALYYIEIAIPQCPKYEVLLVTRKLGVLSVKHNYDAGIAYIPSISDSLLDFYPYYKTILLKRFYAMKSLYEGDSIQRDQYVYFIIEDIAPFIIANQSRIDTLCKNDNISFILQNTLSFALSQYYYYRSIIEDKTTILNEMKLLKQKGYNAEYIELIEAICEEDFLIFQLF